MDVEFDGKEGAGGEAVEEAVGGTAEGEEFGEGDVVEAMSVSNKMYMKLYLHIKSRHLNLKQATFPTAYIQTPQYNSN